MNAHDLIEMGFQPGPAIGVALRALPEAGKTLDAMAVRRELAAVLPDPVANAAHLQFADVARALRDAAARPAYVERSDPAPYRIWGDHLEPTAVDQLRAAVRLPIAVSAALMPDAHLGYGLPIGGVLATDNAVIPYAVGVDIACRMRLTVYDVPAEHLARLDEAAHQGAPEADPVRRRGHVPEAERARGARRRLDRLARHPPQLRQGPRPARLQRQRQPLRRVRSADPDRPPSWACRPAGTWPCSPTAAAAAPARPWPTSTPSSPWTCTPTCRPTSAGSPGWAWTPRPARSTGPPWS